MGWTMLHQAAMEGKVDTIQDEIYKKGTLVNDKTELTGSSALHKACQYGHIRAVEELIKEEALVTQRNDWGCTCMHWVVKGYVHSQTDKQNPKSAEDYIQIVHLLVQASKKLIELRNNAGKRPVDLANELKADEIAAVLEKKGQQLEIERNAAQQKRERDKPKVRRV